MENAVTAQRKVIFVAFAMEDERQRDFLKGQALNTRCPFDYIDMSVREAYESDWKTKVRTRIRRSDGVIALISRSSLASSGQKWEIQCAEDESVPILSIWAYSNDRTCPSGLSVNEWNWSTITAFINGL